MKLNLDKIMVLLIIISQLHTKIFETLRELDGRGHFQKTAFVF